jgi:hypothetical protein
MPHAEWANNYGEQTRDGTIILMPQPAKTVNDPLVSTI